MPNPIAEIERTSVLRPHVAWPKRRLPWLCRKLSIHRQRNLRSLKKIISNEWPNSWLFRDYAWIAWLPEDRAGKPFFELGFTRSNDKGSQEIALSADQVEAVLSIFAALPLDAPYLHETEKLPGEMAVQAQVKPSVFGSAHRVHLAFRLEPHSPGSKARVIKLNGAATVLPRLSRGATALLRRAGYGK